MFEESPPALSEEFREAIKKAARAMTGPNGNLPSVFFEAPYTQDPKTYRGYHDRRSMGLQLLSASALAETAPKGQKGLSSWLSFMDAYGEFKSNLKDQEGFKNNIIAARADLFAESFDHEGDGYDFPAVVMAWDFFRKNTQGFDARFPDIAKAMTPEIVKKAQQYSARHMLMADRLERDGDMMGWVLDDPNAFAHRVAQLIQKEPTPEEAMHFAIMSMGEDNADNTKFIDPKTLFEHRDRIADLNAQIQAGEAKMTGEGLRQEANKLIAANPGVLTCIAIDPFF